MYRQGLMAQGDYYRGDGLFGFIGKALKAVAPVLPFGIGTAVQAISSIGGSARPKGTVLRAGPGVYQQQIGATLPPPPTFSGFQMGGQVSIGTGQALAPGPKRSFGPLSATGRKRRRMNVTNAKALRRAIRRARGFEKLARKVLGFTTPKRPKGRAYFRARAKR